MSQQNISEDQVSAVEKVIATWLQEPLDGYHRSLARECIEAADRVQLAEMLRAVPDDRVEQLVDEFAAAPVASLTLVTSEPELHVALTEHQQVEDLAAREFEAALGEGRR